MNIDSIIEAMKAEVAKHNIKLLEGSYASDLLLLDRSFLETNATTGTEFAWVVGDDHTHICLIGIHPAETSMVECYSALSGLDRYYHLVIDGNGFKLKELSQEAFKALAHRPCAYRLVGNASSGTLMNGSREVGRIRVNATEEEGHRLMHIRLQPARGFSRKDQIALGCWGERGAIEKAGSLFIRIQREELEAYDTHEANAA